MKKLIILVLFVVVGCTQPPPIATLNIGIVKSIYSSTKYNNCIYKIRFSSPKTTKRYIINEEMKIIMPCNIWIVGDTLKLIKQQEDGKD